MTALACSGDDGTRSRRPRPATTICAPRPGEADGDLTQDQARQIVADACRQLVNKHARLEQEVEQGDARAGEAQCTVSTLTVNRTTQRDEETSEAAILAGRLRVIDQVRSSVAVDKREQLDSESARQRQAAARQQQRDHPGETATIGRDAIGLELWPVRWSVPDEPNRT